MLVTGGPPVRGGGGMPQRMVVISAASLDVADHRSRIIGKHAGHRREVADIAVDDAEQARDGLLVRGDAVKVAHLSVPLDHMLHSEALAPKHHLRLN